MDTENVLLPPLTLLRHALKPSVITASVYSKATAAKLFFVCVCVNNAALLMHNKAFTSFVGINKWGSRAVSRRQPNQRPLLFGCR